MIRMSTSASALFRDHEAPTTFLPDRFRRFTAFRSFCLQPQHHGSIERETRLRTVPPNELIDSVSIGFLRTRRRERIYDRIFRMFQVRDRRIVFGFCRFAVFADAPYWRPPVPRPQYGAKHRHIRSRNAVSDQPVDSQPTVTHGGILSH